MVTVPRFELELGIVLLGALCVVELLGRLMFELVELPLEGAVVLGLLLLAPRSMVVLREGALCTVLGCVATGLRSFVFTRSDCPLLIVLDGAVRIGVVSRCTEVGRL